jgi:hypothetical protein
MESEVDFYDLGTYIMLGIREKVPGTQTICHAYSYSVLRERQPQLKEKRIVDNLLDMVFAFLHAKIKHSFFSRSI